MKDLSDFTYDDIDEARESVFDGTCTDDPEKSRRAREILEAAKVTKVRIDSLTEYLRREAGRDHLDADMIGDLANRLAELGTDDYCSTEEDA